MLKLLIIKLPSLKLWNILKVKDLGEHFRDEHAIYLLSQYFIKEFNKREEIYE